MIEKDKQVRQCYKIYITLGGGKGGTCGRWQRARDGHIHTKENLDIPETMK